MPDNAAWWTDARTAQLRELFAAGQTYTQIAAALGDGATRNSVAGKCDRLALLRSGPRQARPQPVNRGYLARGRAMARVAKRRKPKRPKQAPPAPKVVRLPVALPPPPPTCAPIRLIELADRACHWPVGEARGEAQLFCGAARPGERPASDSGVGRSYCAYHARLAVAVAPGRGWYARSSGRRRVA